MTKFLTLVGTMLKNFEASSLTGSFKRLKSTKKRKGRASKGQKSSIRYIFIIAILFFFLQFIQALPYVFEKSVASLDTEIILFNIGSSFVGSLILLPLSFSFASVFSNFFLSKDSYSYLALPIKSSLIWFAKFTVSFVIVAPLSLGLALGYLLSTLLFTAINALAIINTILLTLAASIFAISSSYLLGLLFSEVFRLKKHPQAMVVLCFCFIFVFAIGYSLLTSINVPAVQNFMSDLLQYFTVSIVPLFQVDLEPFTHVLVCLAVALGLSGLAALLGHFTYVKYLNVAAGDSHRKTKKVSAKKKTAIIEKSLAKDHEYFRFLKNENKMLFRTPAFFLNIILPLFLMPLLFSGTLIVTFTALPRSLIDSISWYIPLIVTAVFCFSFFLSNSSICYSKDHMDFFFLSATPINQKKLLLAKITPVLSLSIVAYILVFVFALIFSTDILSTLIISLSHVIGLVIHQLIGVFVDLSTGGPNNADDLYLSKQSKMVVRSMLFCTLYSLIIFVCPQLIVFIEGAEGVPLVLIGSIISLVLASSFLTFLILYLRKNLNRLIRKHLGNIQ